MNTAGLLTGAGLGAALAFILDPDSGNRRRALVRDKLAWASRKTRDGLDATTKDMANRAKGIAAATRGRLARGAVDDATLQERVRSKIGRASSHPRAIDVDVRAGEVVLRGPSLAHEVAGVVAAVTAVRGVRRVDNELEPHETAERIPSLQGEGRVAGPSIDVLQQNWAPATRALVGAAVVAAGAGIAAYTRRHAAAS